MENCKHDTARNWRNFLLDLGKYLCLDEMEDTMPRLEKTEEGKLRVFVAGYVPLWLKKHETHEGKVCTPDLHNLCESFLTKEPEKEVPRGGAGTEPE
jgi:hypothetical protein